MQELWWQWSALFGALPRKAVGLAAWLAAMGLCFGALERWRPLHRRSFWRPAMGRDIGYYFLGGLLPPFGTVLAAAVVLSLAGTVLPPGSGAWVDAWPLGLRLAAMVLLGDLAFYGAHRASHQIPALWRLHAIHHSPTALDWLVNTRAHPLDLVFARAVSALPLLVLGLHERSAAGQAAVAAWLTFSTVWAFFVHSNVGWRLGWLEHLVVTPAFHHWHHANDTPAALNKNHAAVFPWIDRLFGTHHLPADRLPASYGANRDLPDGWLAQLLSPFKADTAPPR